MYEFFVERKQFIFINKLLKVKKYSFKDFFKRMNNCFYDKIESYLKTTYPSIIYS